MPFLPCRLKSHFEENPTDLGKITKFCAE
jgi:hypothetical protein